MTFCASIHCMDGRIHEPVISFIKDNYSIKYIDFIVEAGINAILADATDKIMVDSIVKRVQTSIDVHSISKVFVSGHFDCQANRVGKDEHITQVNKAIDRLQKIYPQIEFIGLWINENWQAELC
jgi:carbonic anhydrase